jgi:phosphatidylethanolamine-binding protein (PEBP) family uncharacterized protein
MNVAYGEQIAKNQVLDRNYTLQQPTVMIKAKPGKLLTLLMTDPDANLPSWLHWMVTNIPGDVPDVENGDVVVAYAPPTPPSGTHTYVFTLYEQLSSIIVPTPEQRGNFNVRDFVYKYALGKPILSQKVRVMAK